MQGSGQDGFERHVLAALVRLAVSAAVLMLAVGWVTPGNPHNTLGRAVLVSVLLAAASYVTLARFLWFLLFPWLLYAAIWLATITGAYHLRLATAVLLALALTFLSFLVSLVFGLRRL